MVLTMLLPHEWEQHERNSLQNDTMLLTFTDRGHVNEPHYTHILFVRINSNSEMQHSQSLEHLNLWHYSCVSQCIGCTCGRTIKNKWDYIHTWWYNYQQPFGMISCLQSVECLYLFERKDVLPFPTYSVENQLDTLPWGTVTHNCIAQIGTQGPCTWLNCHQVFLYAAEMLTALYYNAWFVKSTLWCNFSCYSQPLYFCLD